MSSCEGAIRRAPWFAVLVAACGQVKSPAGDASIDAPAIDAAPIDAGPVTDRSCADIKARLGTTSDGVYQIDPDKELAAFKPFSVHCAQMNTAAPKEYLELPRTSLPSDTPSSNYATYAAGDPHVDFKCNCGVIAMVFPKIRINPANLVVDVHDRTLAVYTNSTDTDCLNRIPECLQSSYPTVPSYAVARACIAPNVSSGRANIDLRDMPFHVADTGVSMFMNEGFAAGGMVDLDQARKVANLQGGGDCGGFGASAGLQLAQDP